MKKRGVSTSVFVLILAFVLCISLFIPVFAESKATISLDELGIKISVPDDYITFTRNTDKNDPNLARFGSTKDEILSYMKNKNIYINSIAPDRQDEIIVTGTDNTVNNLNVFSDEDLSYSLIPLLKTEYDDMGIRVTKTEIYNHSQAKFIKLYQYTEDLSESALQYYTVYNNKAINIKITTFSGAITKVHEAVVKKMVDSLTFNTAPLGNKNSPATESFTYTDTTVDVSFKVPSNWSEIPFIIDTKYLTAKFVHKDDSSTTIMYGATDFFSQLSPEERKSYNRNDFNMTYFTKYEIAEMYEIPIDKMEYVNYGNVTYCKSEIEATNTDFGVDVKLPITQLLTISDGYFFYFQFSGKSDSKYYSDFEALITSVQYPNYIGIYSNEFSNSDVLTTLFILLIFIVIFALIAGFIAQKKGKSFWFHFFISFIVTPLVSIILALYSKRNKPKHYMNPYGESLLFCQTCGSYLNTRSNFCDKCGAIPVNQNQLAMSNQFSNTNYTQKTEYEIATDALNYLKSKIDTPSFKDSYNTVEKFLATEHFKNVIQNQPKNKISSIIFNFVFTDVDKRLSTETDESVTIELIFVKQMIDKEIKALKDI